MNKKKLIGAVMISGSILIALALVWPYYDAIQETRSMIEDKQAEVEKKRQFIDKVTDLRKQIEARRDDLVKVESFLSEGKKTEDVVVNIEAISQEAGVAVSGFKTGTKGGNSGVNYETLQLDLTISGQYAALLNFVKLLERNLRIFDVQEISIFKKEGSAVASPLSLSLKLNTYFIK